MTNPSYRELPEPVRLEDTVAGDDPNPVQGPLGDRNSDQWDALEAGG